MSSSLEGLYDDWWNKLSSSILPQENDGNKKSKSCEIRCFFHFQVFFIARWDDLRV